jgi:hypothetical protein
MFRKLLLIILFPLSLNAFGRSLGVKDTIPNHFNLAVAINQGSANWGLEILSKPFKQLGFRFGHYNGSFVGRYYTIFDGKSILVNGKINYEMSNFLVDYFPFKTSTFRISTGLSYNQNRYQVTLSPNDAQKIGYIFYSPEKLGNVILTAKGNQISPYLGIGFGNTIPKYKIGLGFDLGLFYQGKSKFTVQGNGSFKPSGTAENELLIESAFRKFVFYPFVNFSIRFRLVK